MDDALFSEALDDFELTAFPFVPSCYISSGFCPTGPTFSTTPTLAPTCSSSLVSSSASGSTAPAPLLASSTRYAPPKTEREIQDAIQSTVPQKTRDDTKYCYKVFYEWSVSRQEGVRSYKRTSEQQRQALSDILNHGSKTNAAPQETSSSSSTHLLPALVERGSTSCAFTSQQQLRSLSLTGSTFQGCTVNFYVGPKATTTRKRRRPMVIDDDSSDSD